MNYKFCRIQNHQNKGNLYIEALEKAGYIPTNRDNVQGTVLYLVDGDWRDNMMDHARVRNIPVFLYPHAARPMVIYDGCVKPRPVRCMFTQAPGGLELMKAIKYPYPVEVSGWAFSEIRKFKPAQKLNRVLFAPIHPNGNGYLNAVDKAINAATFGTLQIYCRENHAQLSVRYIGTPEQCGLGEAAAFEAPYIEWHQGKKNNSTDDMEAADLVVAHQTFAFIAVAMGIPTVMMAEDVAPRSGNTEAGFCYVEHWDEYKDLLMFPLDILHGDTSKTIDKAMAGCPEVEDWKARLIGQPFDGPAFVRKLESYL